MNYRRKKNQDKFFKQYKNTDKDFNDQEEEILEMYQTNHFNYSQQVTKLLEAYKQMQNDMDSSTLRDKVHQEKLNNFFQPTFDVKVVNSSNKTNFDEIEKKLNQHK